MKTPVLIPTYNDGEKISRLLQSLPSDVIDPIVISNGSTDITSEIAEKFGSKVYNFAEKGKLPAIQRVLRDLGSAALEPFLLIDADIRPIFPRMWHSRMLSSLEPDSKRPIAVAGPILFTPINRTIPGEMTAIARTAFRYGLSFATAKSSSETGLGGGQYGPNMGFHINKQSTLDRILELPHYWPMEDVAMTQTIVNDGEGVFKQVLNPEALLLNPESDAYLPLSAWFRYGILGDNLMRGIEETNEDTIQNYVKRGAPGSRPFKP